MNLICCCACKNLTCLNQPMNLFSMELRTIQADVCRFLCTGTGLFREMKAKGWDMIALVKYLKGCYIEVVRDLLPQRVG